MFSIRADWRASCLHGTAIGICKDIYIFAPGGRLELKFEYLGSMQGPFAANLSVLLNDNFATSGGG